LLDAFIEAGFDIINPVQCSATGMDPELLKNQYGDRLTADIAETFGRHSLEVGLGLRQPWGNASISLSGTQFWNDARNPNVDLYGSMEVRIVRGLSANFYGGYSFVRSQRFLPALSETPEDVLLQLRQLRTSYEYWGGFGLSYTFGSVYNNVVNPRFGGGGGNMIIMN
jgi:hypothetical protein